MLLVAIACALTFPQGQELAGKVVGPNGAPVAGATVELRALGLPPPPLRGIRSSYRLAMAAQRATAPLPKTVTDRDGDWRMLLSPLQSACSAAESAEMELRVTAPGLAEWRRAIGPAWLSASRQEVRLQGRAAGLVLQLHGHARAYQGFVLVERAFRAQGNRSIWLQELLLVPGNGRVEYREPPRVPGESPAPSPTARLEAYRVTLYCADLEPRQLWLAAGEHTVEVRPSEQPRRKVLRERAELVPGGAVATWTIAGRSVELALDEAKIPLLGNEPPVAVLTKLGPVALDPWDPDAPLFLRQKDEPRDADAAPAARAPEGPFGELQIEVRRKDQPVFGAGVWIEDAACKRTAPGAVVATLTDAQGKATLKGLPHGAFRILVRHAQLGTKEALANVPQEDALSVTLDRREEAQAETAAGAPTGTILLDLGEPGTGAGSGGAEVGLLAPDGRLIRKVFEERSRFVRIEGLIQGPASFYVRSGGKEPVLFGGLLTQGEADPPVDVGAVKPRTYRMHVRDSEGRALDGVRLSLGELTPGDKLPASSGLLRVQKAGDPGSFTVEARVFGNLWARVHGQDGEEVDVLFPSEAQVLDVRLKPPPPAPESRTSRPRR